MTNRNLKIGDVVALIDGDDIQMVIEDMVSKNDKLIAECIWIDRNHKVCRGNHNTLFLKYDGDILSNESIFKESDQVTLKCCYNVSMTIEEIVSKNGVQKAECRWYIPKGEVCRETFNLTSLELAE